MKKSKIFLAMSALMLSVAATLATKVNKKQTASKAYIPVAFCGLVANTQLTLPNIGHFTVNGGGTNNAKNLAVAILSLGGVIIEIIRTLRTGTSGTSKVVYWY